MKFPRFRRARFFQLPDEFQTELHFPASAVELPVVQEQVTGIYERISRAQRIRVVGLIDRAVVGRQTDAVVAVVESIVALNSELHRIAFAELCRLDDCNVPQIQSRGRDRVAPGRG